MGISGIANVLCCIKFAKYYELTEDDVAKFKAVVQPLIDQYKEVYGADACTAFGVQ